LLPVSKRGVVAAAKNLPLRNARLSWHTLDSILKKTHTPESRMRLASKRGGSCLVMVTRDSPKRQT
jgi:hypothetical protein